MDNPYLIFSFDSNPNGGWNDFHSSHPTFEEALAVCKSMASVSTGCLQIVNVVTGEVLLDK